MNSLIDADIAIVGGGAAGLIASIAAAQYANMQDKKVKIIVLEKENRVGKKILMTGNGKCNLTNKNLDSRFYHSNSNNAIDSVLNKFTYPFIVEFFESLGLIFREDKEGRVYPYCDQASSVLDVIRSKMQELKVEEICNFEVVSIQKNKSFFVIESKELKIKAKRVVVSTGGRASILSCKNNNIYSALTGLGHKLTPTFPSLVKVNTNSNFIGSLKGIRCRAGVSVVADGRSLKTEVGELQFGDNVVSGICVFSISRLISEYFSLGTIYSVNYKNVDILIDLFPDYSLEDFKKIMGRAFTLKKKSSLDELFTGIINKRIGMSILKSLNMVPLSRKVESLTSEEKDNIVSTLKGWKFKPKGVSKWENAQVTAGGIDIREFNMKTMESKKEKGLFACGEVLDVDGDCGGFNLHWAWSSGYLAGKSAFESLSNNI